VKFTNGVYKGMFFNYYVNIMVIETIVQEVGSEENQDSTCTGESHRWGPLR